MNKCSVCHNKFAVCHKNIFTRFNLPLLICDNCILIFKYTKCDLCSSPIVKPVKIEGDYYCVSCSKNVN